MTTLINYEDIVAADNYLIDQNALDFYILFKANLHQSKRTCSILCLLVHLFIISSVLSETLEYKSLCFQYMYSAYKLSTCMKKNMGLYLIVYGKESKIFC